MRKTIFKYFYFVSMAVLAVFLSNHFFSASAYEEPTDSPPAGNIGSPIFTTALEQTKSGALGVNGLLDIGNDLIVDNKLGIKQTANNFALEVNGAIRLNESSHQSQGLIHYDSYFDDFCVYNGSWWDSLTGNSACNFTYSYDLVSEACGSCTTGCPTQTVICTQECKNDQTGDTVDCNYCDAGCSGTYAYNKDINCSPCCGDGNCDAGEDCSWCSDCACADPTPDCCGGSCTDVDSDNNNCGFCNNVCSGTNFNCYFGSCGCAPGWADCNGDDNCNCNLSTHECSGSNCVAKCTDAAGCSSAGWICYSDQRCYCGDNDSDGCLERYLCSNCPCGCTSGACDTCCTWQWSDWLNNYELRSPKHETHYVSGTKDECFDYCMNRDPNYVVVSYQSNVWRCQCALHYDIRQDNDCKYRIYRCQ